MFQKLSRSVLLKKIIAVVVSAQFIAGAAPLRSFAADQNLRPTPAKDGGRLTDIRKTLDVVSMGVSKTETILPKDGGSGTAQEARASDPFRAFLGDYKTSATIDNLAYGTFVKQEIDLAQSPKALVNLEDYFGAVNKGDRFYTLTYSGIALALVKQAETGDPVVKAIVSDIPALPISIFARDAEQIDEDVAAFKKENITVVDILVRDFLLLEKRSHVPVTERMVIEFGELRDYVYDLARKVGMEKAKEAAAAMVMGHKKAVDQALTAVPEEAKEAGRAKAKEVGLALAGGKGLSLSVMSRVVDVPPGQNVTTTAYFKFVKENRNVWEKIFNELKALDTMDDQKRDVVTSEIRETIKNSPIPEDIKDEITAMYHQLSMIRFLVTGNPVPAAVAVRSSGTKEDIHVKTWLPVSTGSQAGQSDTFLNVKGDKAVLDKTRADFASLFTDRAVSYRDDATFLQFSGAIDYRSILSQDVYWGIVAKLREYATTLNKPEYAAYADQMAQVSSPNPGSVNLMNAMEEMLKHEQNPEMANALEILRKKSEEVTHPEQIGIDVVIMQMVKSYIAGVLFTVNPATKMAGVAQALYNAWFNKDFSLVFRDRKTGLITGTKAIVASFELAFGYGENVVGGKVSPDKYIMGTYDGVNWFIIEKSKGNKLIQMRNVEEVIDAFKGKISGKELNKLAVTLREAIAYDEVGKRINSILATKLYGIKYLKADPSVDDKLKKARLQDIANEIAQMIKDKRSEAGVIKFIKENFVITSRKGEKGFQEAELAGVVRNVFKEVSNAQKETDRGMKKLSRQFGDMKKADTFIYMIRETWENKEFDLTDRAEILAKLGISGFEMQNLSYLMRALVDNSFTSNSRTTRVHQNMFTLADEVAAHVARMGWNIVEYYGDKRDIELAIEIDRTAPPDKALHIYEVDADGRTWGIDEKGDRAEVTSEADKERIKAMPMRLYNVQARPYTAEYLKVDVIRARTEVDEKWLEEHPEVKPIASGTKGENATHGYVLVFDPNKDVAWHAEQIKRLKDGRFTPEERQRIEEDGFDPDEIKEKSLPIILYLLEADPNHDPIMRLVNSVVTINGGDTCHAAIFCREQGIPAVTGTGKLFLLGQLVKTGDALTVDANNGNAYAMDPVQEKRIVINYVEFTVEPYLIPGDPDNMPIPKIGQIIAATSAAQQNSPIMLATDSAGNSLTRAEFKGEEIGINVYAGYGHFLLQQIKDGKMAMPQRIYAQDMAKAGAQGADKSYAALLSEMSAFMQKHQGAAAAFTRAYGRAPQAGDMADILTLLDRMTDHALGKAELGDLTADQKKAILFTDALNKDDGAFFKYIYGKFQRRFNYNYNVITDLQNHPWILNEVTRKLNEKGYTNFKEYVSKEFLYFYNLMGFTIAPDQVAKNRAYDFAQDKIRGMPGSEIFSWPGVNPLVGLRGTALEIEAFDEQFGGNQLVLDFLFDSVIEAHQNTHNQAWFYVFVRSIRELETLDKIIEMKARQKGMLPKEIGIMIEVPSAALDVPQLAKKLSDMGTKYKKYGVEHTFFSFGTNDYSFLAGMGDREDPKMKLEIMDPAAIEAIMEIKKAGYFYDDSAKRLPLVDEGADVMLQLIETVVAHAGDEEVATSLCGEAITALVNRGDYETAGKIMVLLDSFGVSMMKVRLPASMTRYDVMAATKEIVPIVDPDRTPLLDLAEEEVRQKKGVIKGEIVYFDGIEDLIPDTLKGLAGPELLAKKESLKMQGLKEAQSVSRFFEKIVVIARNPVAFSKEEVISAIGENAFEYVTYKPWQEEPLLMRLDNGLYVWTNLNVAEKKFKEELEANRLDKDEQEKVMGLWKKAWDNSAAGLKRRNIDWWHFQYAPAVIVDADVDLTGWDVFDKNKSINPTRIKAVVKGIGSLRATLEGEFVTIDYGARKIYSGNLEVNKVQTPVRRLAIPETRPNVPIKTAVSENANDAYAAMVYHPKAILAYEKQDWSEQIKIFDDYVSKLVEEAGKVMQETDAQKRAWLLGKLNNKIDALPDPFIRKFMKDVISGAQAKGEVSLPEDWVEAVRVMYFDDLSQGIEKLLGKRTAEQFITGEFQKAMRKAVEANPGKLVVHEMTSLNCAQFNDMPAGFLFEQVNPNRDYGILGAARALGDMWQINRMELGAWKQVWGSLSAADRKNFGLQITNVKGTQAGAVMIAWRQILKEMDIIPGKDGLEVGVNMTTPANVLALDKYMEYFKDLGTGLSFITYDTLKLGAAWAGVDIFWDEWRRLAQEEELERFGTMTSWMAEAKLEAANKADPSANKKVVTFDNKQAAAVIDTPAVPAAISAAQIPVSETAAKPIPMAQPLKAGSSTPLSMTSIALLEIDQAVYQNVSLYFGNVVNAARDQQKTQGAFVIGAGTMLENAGSFAALMQASRAAAVLDFVVWAKDESDAAALRALGVDKIATIHIGLKSALKSVEKLAAAKKVVLINSDLDLDNIKGEFIVADATEFFNANRHLRAIHVSSPNTGGVVKQINAVPLAFAKAMALIFDAGNTRAQFAKMVQAFRDKGMISDADAAALNQLTLQLCDIPLVTVSDDIAKLQVTFEDTLNKI